MGVGITGAAGLSGCLRLAGDEPSAATNTGESTAEADGPGSEFYSSRQEAIEYAGSFAEPDSYNLDLGGGDPQLIRYDDVYASVSSTNGPDGGVVSRQDLILVPISGSIEFGGGTGRRLRVRELITESAALFEPATDEPPVSFKRLYIEFDDGGLEDGTPRITPADGDGSIEMGGSWSVDGPLTDKHVFGRFVVELLDGNEVIGHTAATTQAIGYRWGVDQTEQSAFITRHPTIKQSWRVELKLDGVDAVVEADHRPSDDVFEFDLSEFDVSPGVYDWEVNAYENKNSTNTNRVFWLSYTGATVSPQLFIK
jgi:hypothetical protein